MWAGVRAGSDIAEKSSDKEVKRFYTEHATDVFYVVYGSFTTLETTIQDKGTTLSSPRGKCHITTMLAWQC